MTTELKLPELAESMTSATVTAWLKRPGDRVREGETVVEVDTDKTTVEVDAPVDGVLREIKVPEGTEEVSVGTVLAVIDTETSAPEPRRRISRPATGPRHAAAVVVDEPSRLPDASPTSPPPPPGRDRAVNASPLARHMAAVAALDLSSVTGTGPGGKITKADVDRQLTRHGSDPARSDAEVDPAHTDQPLTAARRVTAERLTRAKQTVPHFYLSSECDMSVVLERRQAYNADAPFPASVTDLMVRAVALALTRVPAANSVWHDGSLRLFTHADIAVAVNTPTGLFTPVVRRADQSSLAEIARTLSTLAERARRGQLTPDEYTGGSFTISNLGMYDVSSLYAIVNPPQSCILGVGAIRSVPVVRQDAVVPGRVVTLTLSADHRALDGATGAELLREIKTLVEEPTAVFG